MINREALETFTAKAVAQIEQGALEDRLRHLLSANLPLIFPDSPGWLQEHILGTEQLVRFIGESGAMRRGFADAIVGKTAIEYEKNLQSKAIFDEGYEQVKEYCAALCNIGVDPGEVLGVLSDTVRWYGYRINLKGDTSKAVGKDNIVLIQESLVDLSNNDSATFDKFEAFVKQFLGRDSSRLLRANVLKIDFGVDSDLYKKAAKEFRRIITECAKENPSYYSFIKSVWSNYIGFLDVSSGGKFPLDTYISELYLVIVAKVLCANILSRKAIVSSRKEIVSILSGEYFRAKNIENFVDVDYFGWLQSSPFAEKFVPFVTELQNIATAYDFHAVINEDIFGELLAQLADRKHRLLLGQELTRRWAAREIVEKCLEKCKVEYPRALDMCCGSGVFLIELVKIARDNVVSKAGSICKREALQILTAATGFDIDPLAIMLAKVNWILTVRDEIAVVADSITIPIYNADSLFVDTPMLRSVQSSGGEYFEMKFYDKKVKLPVLLFKNDNQRMYDALLPTIYRIAMNRAKSKPSIISSNTINTALSSAIKCSASKFQDEELEALKKAVKDLIEVLESLQREGKNGIWYFVLNNVYRPELMNR